MPEQSFGEDDQHSDGPYSPAPHPSERAWRHPSEVGAASRHPSGQPEFEVAEPVVTTRGRRLVTAMAATTVSAIGGGLLIAGLWMAISSAPTDIAISAEPTVVPIDPAGSEVSIESADGDQIGFGLVVEADENTNLLAVLDSNSHDEVIVRLDNDTTFVGTVVGFDRKNSLTGISLNQPINPATIEPFDLSASDAMVSIRGGKTNPASTLRVGVRPELGQLAYDGDSPVGIITEDLGKSLTVTPLAAAAVSADEFFD